MLKGVKLVIPRAQPQLRKALLVLRQAQAKLPQVLLTPRAQQSAHAQTTLPPQAQQLALPAAAAVPQGGAPAVANALQAQAGEFSQATFSNAALDAGGIAGIAPQPDAGQPAQAPPVPPFPSPAFSGLAFIVQHTASWLPQGIANEAQRQEFAASLQRLGKDLNKPRKRR